MYARNRIPPIPELFLGLLSIGLCLVLIAHIFSTTIHDVRHTRDTVGVTGSARKPISANLVRWELSVRGDAAKPTTAARRLRRETQVVMSFLRRGGIPAKEITQSVVTSQTLVFNLPHHRRLTRYRVTQDLQVRTERIDTVEGVAPRVGELLERGITVEPGPIQYLSTELEQAKLAALQAATEEAHRRAEILVHGLGAKLGRTRSTTLGVYQITPRDATDVSDYGINDTTSRDKDVNAVVAATFAVNR